MTPSEENYLKAIHRLLGEAGAGAGGPSGKATVSQVAARLGARPASVSQMLRRLADKGWIAYERYGPIQLTDEGRRRALDMVRRHRLWEVFLSRRLGFDWQQVHDLAEQLEHVDSPELIDRLERYLDYPRLDPHGDLIPDREGRLPAPQDTTLPLPAAPPGVWLRLSGVLDDTVEFLGLIAEMGLISGMGLRSMGPTAHDSSALRVECRPAPGGPAEALSFPDRPAIEPVRTLVLPGSVASRLQVCPW